MAALRYDYTPVGVCSNGMSFWIEDNLVKKINVIRGCPGNLMGISKLVEGKSIDEVITELEGIPCRDKQTSCPDQIAKALKLIKAHKIQPTKE